MVISSVQLQTLSLLFTFQFEPIWLIECLATMWSGQTVLHHCHVVQMSGESYRLKDKRKVGMLPINSQI